VCGPLESGLHLIGPGFLIGCWAGLHFWIEMYTSGPAGHPRGNFGPAPAPAQCRVPEPANPRGKNRPTLAPIGSKTRGVSGLNPPDCHPWQRPRWLGAWVRRGKRRGDRGEHMGLLTLDGGRRRDGRRRTGMAVGSGSHGRRRSGGPPTTENGAVCSARHEETSGGVGLLREVAVATNRRRRRTGRRRRAGAGQGAGQRRLGHAGGSGGAALIGARTPRCPRRARPGRLAAAAPAVAPSASGRWASCGPSGLERVGPSGSAR
jgi:hypothetical protein